MLYCVDSGSRLAAASELVYNDAPWLSAGAEYVFVHPKLSHEVAERVGVRSLRRLLLAQVRSHRTELFAANRTIRGERNGP